MAHIGPHYKILKSKNPWYLELACLRAPERRHWEGRAQEQQTLHCPKWPGPSYPSLHAQLAQLHWTSSTLAQLDVLLWQPLREHLTTRPGSAGGWTIPNERNAQRIQHKSLIRYVNCSSNMWESSLNYPQAHVLLCRSVWKPTINAPAEQWSLHPTCKLEVGNETGLSSNQCPTLNCHQVTIFMIVLDPWKWEWNSAELAELLPLFPWKWTINCWHSIPLEGSNKRGFTVPLTQHPHVKCHSIPDLLESNNHGGQILK